MKQLFSEAKNLIENSHLILLVSHIEPDGDALGAMLALRNILTNLGKQADVFCHSNYSGGLNFLPGAQFIKKDINTNYDLVIGLDYGDIKRLETVAAGLTAPLPDISFDHHPILNQVGKLKIIDTSFSSVCEIIYYFLKYSDFEINKETAICLLTGIFADTWGFRHPNTTARTLEVVGALLLAGASLPKIAKMVNQEKIDVKSKIWSRALADMRFEKENSFVWCFLSFDMMQEFGATTRDLSGLATLLCTVPLAKFSLVLSEPSPGQLDGSFRALPNADVDVSFFARNFDGGGHKLSAGFKTKGNAEKILKKLKDLISQPQKAKL
ncbi:MAG: hypothetical protein A2174_00660 [Candidatus Portnoybacteria bacterium RBG_13_41_18]|uniref:DDH domain-containing protein n=1 Tax=Candidatus Portnoybacteria bacterium RBG_13_41_18 TaxID=1801991 RepID=A0A1G2F645_9BACT|nr:MAG: hypothetical protein A2174_00660 [Candidatus Portnoybacteria bacterium RBG_13_41_18]